MNPTKKSTERKYSNPPRDSKKTKDFIKEWEKLLHSGKHDMNVLKEAMLLLIANDKPLPAEWKDHALKGTDNVRECHVKGDLLLFYVIHTKGKNELIVFLSAGTHSEMF